jgi:hypothetical protein
MRKPTLALSLFTCLGWLELRLTLRTGWETGGVSMKRWMVWFLAAAVAIFASLAGSASAAQRAKPKIKITNKPAVLTVGSTTKLSGRVLGRVPRRAKIVVQQGRRGHFSSKRAQRLRRNRFSVTYRAPATVGALTLRLRVRVGRRTLATSRQWSVKIVGRKPPLVPQ